MSERHLTLYHLKWLTLAAPALFLVAIESVQRVLAPVRPTWVGYLLVGAAVLMSTLIFNEIIFGVIDRIQRRQVQQYHELLALHDAGLDIAAEMDLEVVLQRVIDRATMLVGGHYGGLVVIGGHGSPEAYLTTGFHAPEPTAEVGIWQSVLQDCRPLRFDGDEGLPAGHPPVRSVLAVPILSRGQVLGGLYIARRAGSPRFGADDEETALRFATQAALVIQNARLHSLTRELAIGEERARLAREMHDSLAQVLGYVNMKAQAVQELLRAGQLERTMTQVGQLSEAARDAYADVREGILGLRSSLEGDRGFLSVLKHYLERWQEQYGMQVGLVVSVTDEEIRALPPTADLQLLRIIQEALSNVRKHAGAKTAQIRIEREGEYLQASIVDDGAGFDPRSLDRHGIPRFGLAGMTERAEAVGGTLRIQSSLGEGTCVTVRLPCSSPSRQHEVDYAGAHR